MAIFDFLIGGDSLRSQRDQAKRYAEEAYNPSVFNPQLNVFRERATEGISEGQENLARTQTISSIFRDRNYSLYGGNQAAAIAGSQMQDDRAMRALSQFESELAQADIRAQQQGRQQLARTQTQARQTQAQQEAAKREADLQYEAERDRRMQQLGTTAVSLAGSLAMTPFDGGGSLVSRGLGAGYDYLFGGDEGGASTRPNIPVEQTPDTMMEDEINLLGEEDFAGISNQPISQQGVSDMNVDMSIPALDNMGPVDMPQQQQQTQESPSDWFNRNFGIQGALSPMDQNYSEQTRLNREFVDLQNRRNNLTFDEFQRMEQIRQQVPFAGFELDYNPPAEDDLTWWRNFTDSFGGSTERQRYQQYINR